MLVWMKIEDTYKGKKAKFFLFFRVSFTKNFVAKHTPDL